jgi:site-specific recombinase XerD
MRAISRPSLALSPKRFTRESLQHEIAHVRAFLRFLASEHLAAPGLDTQIDTPRVYRLERLPRSLPWSTVQTFLASIPRNTPLGRRDYAIFLLIATYGLRASEIVDLTLDDIDWRRDTLRIFQRKNGSALPLPLLNSIGNALVDYLRHARPASPHSGTPLKTIGDILGHRSAESTCVYLRLAIDDLRDVALSLPREAVSPEVSP